MAGPSELNAHVLFLSFLTPDYSRSGVLLNFDSPRVEKHFKKLRPKWTLIIVDLWRLRRTLEADSIVVVMSPCHKIAIVARVILKNRIILDAGWPLTDGALSRHLSVLKKYRILSAYVIDFLAFHSAGIVLLETKEQVQRVHRLFRVPLARLKVSYTSLNETCFKNSSETGEKIDEVKLFINKNPQRLKVLFRGKVNNESGMDNILAAAKLLEQEADFIFVVGAGNSLPELGANCIQIVNVSNSELKAIYSLVDVALGQLSDHPRLKYTIPHKAFEAGYFSKCYLTTLTPGIKEIYQENSICELNQPTAVNLAAALSRIKEESAPKTKQIAINGDYVRKVSQKATNDFFEEILFECIRE